jgi:hypothetical protein
MYEQVEKPKGNKGRAVANSTTQKKSRRKQGCGFVDNRSTTIQQRVLIQTMDTTQKNASDSGSHLSTEEDAETTGLVEDEYTENDTVPITFDVVRTEEDAQTETTEEPAQLVRFGRGRRAGMVRYYESRGRRDQHVQWQGRQHPRNHVTYVHRNGQHSLYWPATNTFVLRGPGSRNSTRRRLLRIIRDWERQFGQRL